MLFEKGNLTLDNLDAKSKPRFIQALLDIIDWLKQKLKGNKEITLKLVRLETKYLRALNAAQKAWEQKQQTTEQQKTSTESGGQYSVSDGKFTDYDKPITLDDIKTLRDIGRKSINDFSTEEIEIAQKWAYKFYQQLGTKSPFFRRWFGDWRAYDKNTKRKYLSLNILAINASDVSRETAKNIDTNWSIEVSRNGIDETSNKRGKWSNEYHSLANIQEMLVNAVLLDTVVVNEPSKRLGNNSAFLHHMYCPVSIDGEKGIAKLYVTEEVGNINKFYLVKIEMVPTDSTVLGIEAFAPNSSVDTELSVADIFRFVKENNDKFESDSDNPIPFTPKPVSEVLINKDDGKPKVFYHGTNENFTEFSPDEFAPREGSFFFAENREDAAAYGNNIFEVYLRGENLADYDNQPLEFYRLRDKRKQVEYLKERGYDGWYADMDSDGWGEVSVFSPSQIKSAKNGGNIGTFSEAENDIQYSLPDGENTDFTAEMDALDEQYQNGEIDRADYLEQMNDLYRKAGETYGTIKQGETVTGNENFDNPVPQSVDGNKQTWALILSETQKRRYCGVLSLSVFLRWRFLGRLAYGTTLCSGKARAMAVISSIRYSTILLRSCSIGAVWSKVVGLPMNIFLSLGAIYNGTNCSSLPLFL